MQKDKGYCGKKIEANEIMWLYASPFTATEQILKCEVLFKDTDLRFIHYTRTTVFKVVKIDEGQNGVWLCLGRARHSNSFME